MISIYHQIMSLCRILTCNMSTSHMDSPFCVFFLLPSVYTFSHLVISFLLFVETDLQTKMKQLKSGSVDLLLCSFAPILPSLSCYSVTSHVHFDFFFILLHMLFCEKRRCSREGGGFLGPFFPPQCIAAGRSKGIMTELYC